MKRSTTKGVVAILAMCFTIAHAGTVNAQSADGSFTAERVAVLPFVNTTSVEQWNTLGVAMADTIELTLRLSNQFDVVDIDNAGAVDPYGPTGPLELRAMATENRLDAVIIGRISDVENGRVELQAAAYSTALGEIIGEETRRAFGSFDILDAADELVIVASSAFLGYSVDFGGIVLQPSRTDVPFRVYVDGILLGQNLPAVPQVLTGQRTIDVATVSSDGERVVYSSEVTLRPGEAVEIPFTLPAVTSRENRRIRTSHAVAQELLGQPEEYLVAFEALSESRRLLLESTSARLEPLRIRQQQLEMLWQLEEELFRLRPDFFGETGAYEPGYPFAAMRRSAEIAGNQRDARSHDAVESLLQRNGAAQYYLLHIAWTEALSRADMERAELIMDDLDRVDERFQLAMGRELRADRSALERARTEAEGYAARRRRPWPYLGLAAGLGGVGYGGYLLATDETVPWDNADQAEIAQWTSLGAGGVVALASTWRIFRNRRAGDSFMKNWATERYGREIAIAEQIFTPDFAEVGPTDGTATVLALGPTGTVADIDGQPRVFPFVIEVPAGEQLRTDRAPFAEGDRGRIYRSGFATAVYR